jgi:hypothetical protein
MEYTVEITIPEAREDLFMAIFDALVDGAEPVVAVGEMQATGAPSHVVIPLDAADAHAAGSEAVRLFRAAVEQSGVDASADTTITGLLVEAVSQDDRPQSQPAPAPA